jgi:uncharacterized protein YjiS (DUF1127 family)
MVSEDWNMRTIDTILRDVPGLSVYLRQYRARYLGRFMAAFVWAIAHIDLHLERRRSRRLLLEMTDEQLRDIGISRADAYHEGRRPFWD